MAKRGSERECKRGSGSVTHCNRGSERGFKRGREESVKEGVKRV